LSIAESFAKAGVEQLVLIQRRQELLDNAKKTLEADYPNTKVTTYAASVTDFDRITSILKEVGKIDILVSNVATSHIFAPSSEISTADFKMTIDTNLTSTYHIIKEFMALKSSGPRAVITTSSAAGQLVQPGTIGYGPSKAASNQMIQYFAMENMGTDVTFQTYHPGAIYTEGAARITPEGALVWEDSKLTCLCYMVQTY
jgi:3-hydroxy acid dehydrogenase/malonic semialdehyde reductase